MIGRLIVKALDRYFSYMITRQTNRAKAELARERLDGEQEKLLVEMETGADFIEYVKTYYPEAIDMSERDAFFVHWAFSAGRYCEYLKFWKFRFETNQKKGGETKVNTPVTPQPVIKFEERNCDGIDSATATDD